jgi:hypothetical protein
MLFAALFGGLTLCTDRASALQVFAHRYGFTCQQCHTIVPQLNSFGRYFQRHGFRLADARVAFPIAVKVQTVYSSNGSGNPASGLPKAIVDEVELLSAGSVGRNASYFFEQYAVDGGYAGRPRDMWLQFDRQTQPSDTLATTLHARIGEFTLPLPVDPETQRPTLQHYDIFDRSVGANAFTLFDPRLGTDLSVTNDRHGIEAHVVLAQAYDRASGIPSDGLDVMVTFAKTLSSDLTAYVYRYQGQRATAPQHDRFYRQGYTLDFQRGRLDTTALLQNGFDTSADAHGLGARSSGGFLQAGWRFNTAMSLYARYDDTYDPFTLRQTSGTLALVFRAARNVRMTIEGTRGPDKSNQLGLGLLFAY